MAEFKAKPILLMLVAIVTVVFVVGVGVLVFFLVRPRGEKVAEISLQNATAEVAVAAAAGDSLYFCTDMSIATADLGTNDSDARDRRVTRFLRASTLTIRAVSPTGTERSSSCPIYNGRSSVTSDTPSSYSMTGMLNDCVVTLDSAGTWKVHPSVTWASDLSPRSATLEVRRESSKK